jgi:hypothetical protein
LMFVLSGAWSLEGRGLMSLTLTVRRAGGKARGVVSHSWGGDERVSRSAARHLAGRKRAVGELVPDGTEVLVDHEGRRYERLCVGKWRQGEFSTESPLCPGGATPCANRESRDKDAHGHLGDRAPSYDG